MRRYFIVGSRVDELLRLACLPFLPTKLARLRCVLVAHWLARVHRELIVNLAARHRMPAIYAFRVYVAGGGLMFFGPDAADPTGVPPATLTAFSRARNPQTCQCRPQQNTSL